MRIGIYLGDFTPDVGGGFTFQDDVFRAFVKIAAQSSHHFVVMGTADNLREYVKTVSGAGNFQTARVVVTSINQQVEALKTYSSFMRRVLPGGPIERVAEKLGLDCLWYVGGGAYEATDIPYVATVWDLQHRMTPWFPEMSAGGTWDARECSYRRFLQRASYVVTGTEVGRIEISLCYGVTEDRMRVLPHPTPAFALERGTPNARSSHQRIKITGPYLLYTAQFWPHKNHINLLHALAILRDKHGLPLSLILAGSEKGNIEHVKETVKNLKLTDQVFFTGFVTQAELVDLYRGASMLVYASFCGPENLPPLEAFALGCPVAAAEVPGSKEQLQSAAIFFNPADPADMANIIQRLHSDTVLRSELIARGLGRAGSWTAQEFSQGVLALFDDFANIRRCWSNGVTL